MGKGRRGWRGSLFRGRGQKKTRINWPPRWRRARCLKPRFMGRIPTGEEFWPPSGGPAWPSIRTKWTFPLGMFLCVEGGGKPIIRKRPFTHLEKRSCDHRHRSPSRQSLEPIRHLRLFERIHCHQRGLHHLTFENAPDFHVKGRRIGRNAVEQTVTALAAGGVVIFPTDTVYGIAANVCFAPRPFGGSIV
jgi:hypothetical protein